jgi:hypothetical protein
MVAAGGALAVLLVCSIVGSARADAMDPALERLGGGDGCAPGATVCADQAAFERLASELAGATALPAMGPAATLGSAGFGLAFSSTMTDVSQDAEHWRLGSRGSAEDGVASDRNAAPMPVLVWNHLEARKGLPFGFEIGVDLAQGLRTSFWTPALWLKWALLEGFRERYGPMPDVALRAGFSRSVGSSQVAVEVAAFDLAMSRSFMVARTWSLTPFIGGQLLLAHVETAVVDLTQGEDAFAACAPDPPPARGVTPIGEACVGTGEDFANDVAFDPLHQTRVRLAGGAEARWELFRVCGLLHFDLLAPELSAAAGAGLRQLAFDLMLGIVL